MRSLLTLLTAAVLSFLLIWMLGREGQEAATSNGPEASGSKQVRAPGAPTASLPGRLELSSKLDQKLLEQLLFGPDSEAAAAHAIRRSCAVGVLDFHDVMQKITGLLVEDIRKTEPRLTNSRHVVSVLTADPQVTLQQNARIGGYLAVPTRQRHHADLQSILRVLHAELVGTDWLALLEGWSTMSAKEFERRLIDLIASAPRTGLLVAGLLLEEGMIKRAEAHVGVVVSLLLKQDPGIAAPHLVRAFGNAQARSGGGHLNNFAMLSAQKFSSGAAALGGAAQDQWMQRVLACSAEFPQDKGVDMFTTLVAAASPNNEAALPALSRILSRSTDASLRDMVLTNIGRVAKAETVVSIASAHGVNIENPPRNDVEIRMQATLATALINALGRRPQDQDVVGQHLRYILNNWSVDTRCHGNLVFILNNLRAYPMSSWQSDLEALTGSNSKSVARAARSLLASWGGDK